MLFGMRVVIGAGTEICGCQFAQRQAFVLRLLLDALGFKLLRFIFRLEIPAPFASILSPLTEPHIARLEVMDAHNMPLYAPQALRKRSRDNVFFGGFCVPLSCSMPANSKMRRSIAASCSSNLFLSGMMRLISSLSSFSDMAASQFIGVLRVRLWIVVYGIPCGFNPMFFCIV